MTKFQIIKNSESESGFQIEDKNFKGIISGLCCGWMFEFVRDGEVNYGSVQWFHGTPEECANEFGEENSFEMERYNGWQPTGRVVFRGYGEDVYDVEDHEWYIEEVNI